MQFTEIEIFTFTQNTIKVNIFNPHPHHTITLQIDKIPSISLLLPIQQTKLTQQIAKIIRNLEK